MPAGNKQHKCLGTKLQEKKFFVQQTLLGWEYLLLRPLRVQDCLEVLGFELVMGLGQNFLTRVGSAIYGLGLGLEINFP